MPGSGVTSEAGCEIVRLDRPELVLIDLDGTLVDSVPDLAWCIDEMMAELGLPRRGEDQVRLWVGNGVERLVERALAGSIDGKSDDALFERALSRFLQLYNDALCERSFLYPGVQQALEFLRETGVKTGVVTNKISRFTLPMLHKLGIHDHFDTVICGDMVERKKPDPQALLKAAEEFGIDPVNCLMMGDSRSDVKAARAAGFGIICVSYGYNHGEDISDYQPDAVVDSLLDVRALIDW